MTLFSAMMSRFLRPLCLAGCLMPGAAGPALSSDATAEAEQQPARPKIGLVLSGGGARGAAHIGIIKVLEQHRIPVDVVVGTSFGALVGGLYAAGRTASELEQALLSVDWELALRSTAPREARSFRRKQDDGGFLVKLRVGVKDGELRLPDGFIQNENIRLALRQLLLDEPQEVDFDELVVPFRAVAAELGTGQPVVLDRGNLVQSILASAAVPGVFPPVTIDGRRLVDGGIADNLPIDVARALGAEVLIVVDITTPPKASEEVSGINAVLDQMVAIMVYRTTQAQRASLGPGDILIEPELGALTTTEFARAHEAIPAGEAAARAAADRLKALALSEVEWGDYVSRRWRTPRSPAVIDILEIANSAPIDDRVIREVLDIELGQPITADELDRSITRVYGLDYFDAVDYALFERDGRRGLRVTAEERAAGTDYLRFGLGLQDNFDGDAAYNAAVSYTDLGVNGRGGEWRSFLQLGDNPTVFTEFYQPIDYGQTYFAFGNIELQQDDVPIRDADRNQVAEIELRTASFTGSLGRNLGSWGALFGGFVYVVGDFETEIGEPQLLEGAIEEAIFVAQLAIDTFDNNDFPRRGISAEFIFEDRLTILGGDTRGQSFETAAFGAYSWGANTLLGVLSFGTNFGDEETAADLFGLGGFLSLSGFSRDELNGPNLTQAAALFYRQVTGDKASLLSFPVYVGASVEAGNVWARLDDFAIADLILGGSVFVGADTVIGPVYLGGGVNTEGDGAAFLFIGQIF